MIDAIEVEVNVEAAKPAEGYQPLRIKVDVRPEADNLAEAVVAGLREATRIAAERLGVTVDTEQAAAAKALFLKAGEDS